jgi:predicted RNA-binding protein with PIN domain
MHYIIDGNNIIGKIKSLYQIQKKDKQQSRERLAFIIGRYFTGRKVTVSLHFDGFENESIKVPGIKIIYSCSITADERVRREIERSNNPKTIILVTSDNNLAEFARVCSCRVISSEEFAGKLLSVNLPDQEQLKIDAINSNEEFKKLFGVNSSGKK